MMTLQGQGFYQALGVTIRAARIIQGFSQQDLAQHIGVSFQQLQKYEVGKNAISLHKLNQISKVLETSFVSFLSGADFKNITSTEFIKSMSEKEILKVLNAGVNELSIRHGI